MKKIIVPVDFSLNSENALRTASYFAKNHQAEIIVVHMLELSSAVMTVSQSYIKEQAAFQFKIAEQKFNDFLNKPYISNIKVTPIIHHYKSFTDFHKIAVEENADIIIMSSQGVSGIREIFVGSNTEVVVRNSTIPVLVIKGLPISNTFKKAIFACDFSDDFIEPYKQAKQILDLFECDLQLVYVNTPGTKFRTTKEKEERITRFLNKISIQNEKHPKTVEVSDFNIEDGILEYARSNNNDLIVMPTHGKHGIEHFFEGSIAEDVVNHASLPVLTIKI